MGQILILEGEDFSNNPNAINVADLPVVTDSLFGFYTGYKSELGAEDAILSMPPVFSDGPEMTRISGQTRSPILYEGSSLFKGRVIRYRDSQDTDLMPGLIATAPYDFTEGVSFTFLLFNPNNTTNGNRVLFSIQPISLQLRINSTSGLGHLQIGNSGSNISYDIDLHGFESAPMAITLVVKQNEAIIYKDGELLGTADISGSVLPATADGSFVLGSTWVGSAGLLNHQIKQFYFHSKELSLSEVQSIHASLPGLLA